jgi:hypothetical protein
MAADAYGLNVCDPVRDRKGGTRCQVMPNHRSKIYSVGLSISGVMRAGAIALVGLLVAACTNSDQATTSSATARPSPPWVTNLNEPPPKREPADAAQSHPRR